MQYVYDGYVHSNYNDSNLFCLGFCYDKIIFYKCIECLISGPLSSHIGLSDKIWSFDNMLQFKIRIDSYKALLHK
jgi:hypothetical protein